MHVAVLLYDGVDLLDAGGPYEVFLTANRMAERQGAERPFELTTLTTDGRAVAAYGGLRLVPHRPAVDAGPVDVLVIPGAIDINTAVANRALRQTIADLTARAGVNTSVCTGAFLLADQERLAGIPWTTHWEDIDKLARHIGRQGARSNVRWVDAGAVVTSGGLACGIDMALHMVDRLAGRELAQRTARQLDTPWEPDPRKGSKYTRAPSEPSS